MKKIKPKQKQTPKVKVIKKAKLNPSKSIESSEFQDYAWSEDQ